MGMTEIRKVYFNKKYKRTYFIEFGGMLNPIWEFCAPRRGMFHVNEVE